MMHFYTTIPLELGHNAPFWQNKRRSLDTLKKSAQNCIFVAIKFKGRVTKDWLVHITEIGVTTLDPPNPEAIGSWDSLLKFFDSWEIPSSWIRIKKRFKHDEFQTHHHRGHVQEVEVSEAETALVDLVSGIHRNAKKPLVLVGFDLATELTVIASCLTRVAEFFTSCADLQGIVSGASGITNPDISDTLLALGFSSPGPGCRGENDRYNAGNNAVRAMAVLVGLFQMNSDNTLTIHPAREQQENKPKPRGFQTRVDQAFLRASYPFTVRVRVKFGDLSSVIQDPSELFDMFPGYLPTAVGMAPTGHYGWVCLESEGEMEEFIEDIDGAEIRGRLWGAFADYNPQVSLLKPYEPPEIERTRLELEGLFLGP